MLMPTTKRSASTAWQCSCRSAGLQPRHSTASHFNARTFPEPPRQSLWHPVAHASCLSCLRYPDAASARRASAESALYCISVPLVRSYAVACIWTLPLLKGQAQSLLCTVPLVRSYAVPLFSCKDIRTLLQSSKKSGTDGVFGLMKLRLSRSLGGLLNEAGVLKVARWFA